MKKLLSIFLAITMAVTMMQPPSLAFGAENETAVASRTVSNEVSVSGTDSTGELLSQEISAKQSEHEANNGCNIYTVEVIGKKATVAFDTTKDCTVLVAVYDEEGKRLLASGKKEVNKGDQEAEISIDASAMPKYFYLRAFLIDSESLEPLASAYESPNYTKEMVEFLDKTVNDFDNKQVVNFDSNKKNNFAVYDENTKVIKNAAGRNVVEKVDDTKQQYIIGNIDGEISALKAGDIFAYEYEKGKNLIVKVKSINISGTTATIQGQNTDLEEVFEYVKIDTDSTVDTAEVDNSNLESGITYNGKISDSMQAQGIGFENTVGRSLSYSINGDILNGSIKLKIETKFKLYVERKYKYVELSFNTVTSVDVDAKGKADKGFSVGEVTFRPIPVVEIALTPKVELEFTMAIKYSAKIKKKYGATYDSNYGYKEASGNPTVESTLDAEGQVFVGISFKPAVNVIDEKIISIYCEIKGGIELKAERHLYKSTSSGKSERHNCEFCLDGEIDFKSTVACGVKLGSKQDVSGQKSSKSEENKKQDGKHKIEAKIFDFTGKITDFYYSKDHNEFGLGTCPYIQYRVTATVKDQSGQAIQNALVNGEIKSNKSGVATLWLANGKYKIPVTKEGYEAASKSITVHDEATSINVNLSKSSDVGNTGEVKPDPTDKPDSANGNGVKMVSLSSTYNAALMENGDLYVWKRVYYDDLGIEIISAEVIPVKIMSDISSVSCGGSHIAAITKKGELYMMGYNSFGQLGNGTNKDSLNKPIKIMKGVKKVSLGDRSSAVITDKDELFIWGDGIHGEIGDGKEKRHNKPVKVMDNVKDVSLGRAHSAAITKKGILYVWGTGNSGQLGLGKKKLKVTKPQVLMENVKMISLSDDRSAAVTQDGELYVWGNNYRGAIGDGTKQNRYTPVKLMDGIRFVDLGGHGAAITEKDTLYMWGSNYHGQLGIGRNVKNNIGTFHQVMEDVSMVSLGENYSAAVTKAGELLTWGYNKLGQLGDGSYETSYIPKKVEIIQKTKDISSMAVSENLSTMTALAQGTSVTTSVKKKTYTKLYANTMYNFYIMKDRSAKDPLAADNLLYIGQKTTNSKGSATFNYGAKESCSSVELFVTATPADDLRYYKPTIKTSNYSYTGKVIKPEVKLVIHGKTLKNGKDFTVRYKDNKSVGTAAIILEGKGTYDGSTAITFNIVPKKTVITSASSPAKKTIQVKWKKNSQATGYQIYASKSSKFASPQKISVKGRTKLSCNITKLTSKKKYYVKIRAYKTVDGKTYYGSWSAVKAVTVK